MSLGCQQELARYERRINYLQTHGFYTDSIETTVSGALKNIEEGVRSFVIYGEPQSGKTEMMDRAYRATPRHRQKDRHCTNERFRSTA